jgi:acyl carrier protein
MNVEIDLQEYIAKESPGAFNGRAPEVNEPLISSGRIDSLGLLQILGYIEERYGIDLMALGTPDRFDTIAGLALAVKEARDA